MRIDNSYLSGLIPGEIRTNTEGSEPGQRGRLGKSATPIHHACPFPGTC